ncbi:MAG: primosomal replication protein N [Burkholderiales bacterium]
MTGENEVAIAGRLVELGALRHTPGGIPVVEFRLRHESERAEAGATRKVNAEIEAIAFQTEARMIGGAALGSMLRVEGFLCARSRRSKKPILHVTKFEFMQGV